MGRERFSNRWLLLRGKPAPLSRGVCRSSLYSEAALRFEQCYSIISERDWHFTHFKCTHKRLTIAQTKPQVVQRQY